MKAPLPAAHSAPDSLEPWEFHKVATRGFGDGLNSFAHTMAWFQNHLYVGTTRANLFLLKGRLPLGAQVWPVQCPDDVYDLDLRAQIWRFNPQSGAWRMVLRAPMITGHTSRQVPREIGYRAMAVFQASGDPAPALYVMTWAPSRALGPLVLKCTDGENFVPVTNYAFGPPAASFRTLVPFRNKVFTSPTGRSGGKPNTPDLPIVLESSNPAGVWRPASSPGFGDPTNLTVFEMAVFNSHLYAGTMNAAQGFQIWKTRAEGPPPYRWQQVVSHGAGRGPLNEGVLSMCVFRGDLYVGSCIQNGGHDLTHQIGPAAPELIRIRTDDSWDLIAGEPRNTPNGPRNPLSGFGPGFDSGFNGYFWRIAEHQGSLYVGTLDWSVMLPYLNLDTFPRRAARLVERFGVDNLVNIHGGFDLYSSADGVNWRPVTTNGFGNRYNFGARTMVSTPYGLFLGTANPFGSHVAVPTANGWAYAPNPNGGTEVWCGARRSPL